MRIVALMKDDNWSTADRVFLVEMTAKEISTVMGKPYDYPKVKIGMEVDVSEIFAHTKRILAEKHVTINAAKNLRAVAELLESIEPIVADAIKFPQEEKATKLGD